VFNPFVRNNLQPSTASPEQPSPTQNSRKRGRERIDYPAAHTPTMKDIIAVAEFYETEGHVTIKGKQLYVQMGQNDPERLYKYCKLFGGKVYGPYTNMAGNDTYMHVIVRERALGFMFTIFTFLTRGRRDQFIATLRGEPQKRIHQATVSNEGMSEAYFNRKWNEYKASKEREQKKGTRAERAMAIFGMKRK
jgi:hypothetical protein